MNNLNETTKSTNESLVTLYELEKQYIIKTLIHFNNNKADAAHSLGITIKTLYNKLHEYGLFEEYAIQKRGSNVPTE